MLKCLFLVLNSQQEILNVSNTESCQTHSLKHEIWNEELLTECLDGFVMLLDSDSTILYITESVTIYLGLTQVKKN